MIEQIIIVTALISFLAIGFYVKRGNFSSIADFTMKKGQLGWFPIAAGISMTFAGGAAILNMASLGYTFKWYTLVDPVSLIVGIIIVLILYDRYSNDNGTTISDLLSFNNRKLNILIGLITSFVFILIVAAQFVAVSKLVSPYFPSINPLLLTTILSTAIFAYVFWGGFNSVTKTDVLQLVFIAIFLITPLTIFLISKAGTTSNVNSEHLFLTMPLNYIVLFSIPILFIPLSQDINIRIKSAKSIQQGKIGLAIGALLYFVIVLCSSYIGIYLANAGIELSDTEQSYSYFFKEFFKTFGFIGIIAALAAIVSSLDSYSLNAITSISNDIIGNAYKKSKQNHTKALIRLSALITYVVALSIALFFNEILALILTALLTYIAVLFPIAFGNWLKLKSDTIFVIAILIIVGILFVEIFTIRIEHKAIIYPLFGLLLMFGSLILKIWQKES